MMTLEKFTEYMTRIQEYGKEHEKLYPILSDELLDLYYKPVDNMIRLLADLFGDTTDWIGYWTYELGYGEKYKDGSVTIHDEIVKLKTIEDLYKVLVDNYESNV